MSISQTSIHKVISVSTTEGWNDMPDGRMSRWTQTTWITQDGHSHSVVAFLAPIDQQAPAPLTTTQPIKA